MEGTVAVATPTAPRYRAAWAVLLGSFLIALPLIAGRSVQALLGASVDARLVEQLLVIAGGFVALQLFVLFALVTLEHRSQRSYWSAPIPVTIVIAQVLAGLGGVADPVEPAFARSLS